jgi:protein phosphatase PTC2/3
VLFVRRGIAARHELQDICENLMHYCLDDQAHDNMTMIIVALLGGRTKEEWYDMIAERVANSDGPCGPEGYGKYSTTFVCLFQLENHVLG